MNPNFESPVHTARDMLERNITLYDEPGSKIWQQFLIDTGIPEYMKLAETMVITESYAQYDKMTQNEMLNQGTHAMMAAYLMPREKGWATEYDHDQGVFKYNSGRGYYKGERLSSMNPLAGYLTHKKWHLNEVFTYILLLQFASRNSDRIFFFLKEINKY